MSRWNVWCLVSSYLFSKLYAMDRIQDSNSFELSNIIDTQEYERLRGMKEGFINHGRNEDNLYGVYMPREQKIDEKWAFAPASSGTIEFDLLPDVVCVNLGDLSPIEWIEKYWENITILDGGELRKWNIKVLAGKPLGERYSGLKLLRLSVGTIDIVTSKNKKWEEHTHIPTVHRGRTGFPHAWDMRTTTAGWALHGDLSTESLREAVEESGMIWVNKDGEFEICLPEIEWVNRGTVEYWMDYAIETFLKSWGKHDLFIGKEAGHKWNEDLKKAWEYARKVFGRNFHWSGEKFTPWVLKSILLSIKEWKRYSYRKTRNMTASDEIVQDVGSENFREVIVHEWNKSHGSKYWIDNDPSTFHVFRIQTDIEYPEDFKPIFRFYSESWVHYQRNPRIENLTGETDTTGLKNPSSIDMKPVPFLQKFAKQAVEGRTKRRTIEAITS